jgi:hypothetical protein
VLEVGQLDRQIGRRRADTLGNEPKRLSHLASRAPWASRIIAGVAAPVIDERSMSPSFAYSSRHLEHISLFFSIITKGL